MSIPVVLIRDEQEFLSYAAGRGRPDYSHGPADAPDQYPCLITDEYSFDRGWQWRFDYLYVEDVLPLLQAAGLNVVEIGK